MKNLFALVLIFFFLGCAAKYPQLNTVDKVKIESYLGKWYEITRYENSFERGCENPTANYSLNQNGDINVLNSCIKNGKIENAVGIAKPQNDSNTKLKVTFFWPFWGDYWIIDLDKDYQYAVIGEPSRKYFWILSRKQKLDSQNLKAIIQKMPKWGYDPNNLIWIGDNKI